MGKSDALRNLFAGQKQFILRSMLLEVVEESASFAVLSDEVVLIFVDDEAVMLLNDMCVFKSA